MQTFMHLGLRFLPLFTMSAFALAGGDGSGVGHGGGASEQAVVYAYQNFLEFTEPCWRAEVCHLDRNERALLLRIKDSIPAEQKKDLAFLTSKELGEAMIRTAPEVGALIEINKDRLWTADVKGDPAAYTLEDALELVTTALAMHHPLADSRASVALAKHIRKFALGAKISYLHFLSSTNLRAITDARTTEDRLILQDGYAEFVVINPLIAAAAGCADPRTATIKFYGLKWGGLILPGSNPVRTVINGRVKWRCAAVAPSLPAEIAEGRANFTVVLETMPVTGTVEEFWRDRKSNLRMIPGRVPEVMLSGVSVDQ